MPALDIHTHKHTTILSAGVHLPYCSYILCLLGKITSHFETYRYKHTNPRVNTTDMTTTSVKGCHLFTLGPVMFAVTDCIVRCLWRTVYYRHHVPDSQLINSCPEIVLGHGIP